VPRYFFDLRDGDMFSRDHEGTELDGVEAARREAAQTLAQMGKDVLPEAVHRELAIEVRTDGPEPLLRAVLVYRVEVLA
jgi:hypothetical protein